MKIYKKSDGKYNVQLARKKQHISPGENPWDILSNFDLEAIDLKPFLIHIRDKATEELARLEEYNDPRIL